MDSSNSVQPPWGYELLNDQHAITSTWKFQLFTSIVVGGYYWDMIISLPRDLQFIFMRRFNYATVLFVVNRISAVIALTNSWLFAVYTGPQCLAVYKLAVVGEVFCIFTSQALLLIRVRALYNDNTPLLIFMLAFMFASPTFAFVEAMKTGATNLPGNVGCLFGVSSPYVYLIFTLQATFDCLCFVLCTYKLYKISAGGGFMKISREMFNGGFIYYIPNVIIQIATIILTLQKGSDVQFITPPAADGVASAQALRITRDLWRSGQKKKDMVQYSKSLGSSTKDGVGRVREVEVSGGSGGSGGGVGAGSGHQLADMRGVKVRAEEFV